MLTLRKIMLQAVSTEGRRWCGPAWGRFDSEAMFQYAGPCMRRAWCMPRARTHPSSIMICWPPLWKARKRTLLTSFSRRLPVVAAR